MASGFPPPRIVWTKAATSGIESGSSGGLQPMSSQTATGQAGQRTTAALTGSSGAGFGGLEVPKSQHHLNSWRPIVSSPHLQVYENGSLNVLDARDSDFGYYMCQANNGVGAGLSKVIRVTINVAAQFSSRHSVQYVTKGEQAQLRCQAKGDWPLAIYWFKNKSRLEPVNLQEAQTIGSAVSGQPQQPGSSSLLSSTLASTVLLVPGSTAPSASPTNQRPPDGGSTLATSVLEQLGALLFSPSVVASGSSSGNTNQLKQQPGILMAKYSISSAEFALVSSGLQGGSAQELAANLKQLRQQQQHHHHHQQQQQQQTQMQLANPIQVQVSSVLGISQAERQDTGTFKCLAGNHFGLDERTIQLIVQEPPERIEDISLLEVNSRAITLAWLAPYDGNAPLTSYHLQYKAVGLAMGSQNQLQLVQQSPTGEQLAEPWLNFTLPAATPSSGSASSTASLPGSIEIHISEAAGPTDSTLGVVQSSGRTLVKINVGSLRPITRYWFRVAAENKLGRGPASSLVETLTMEEAPGAAPTKVKALAQSSSTILVSWSKLNEKELFGSVHGYYVAYKQLPDGPADGANNSSNGATPEVGLVSHPVDSNGAHFAASQQQSQHQQPSTNIYKTIQHDDKLTKFDALLTGLKRSSKYVISVQAFNARGTGPSSEPILVRTLDMDSPRQVKLFALQTSNCTIQIGWRPFSQAALQLATSGRAQLSSGVSSGTSQTGLASTLAGPQVTASQRTIIGQLPVPVALVQPTSAESSLGLELAGANLNNKLEQADVVDYYSLYQAEITERPKWHESRLPGHASSHTIEGLRCGTRYQFYMVGVNRIGAGDQSDILDTKTRGGLPIAPDRQAMLDVVNATCFIIRLDRWHDNSCPINQFEIQYKQETSRDWIKLAHFSLNPENLDPTSGDAASDQSNAESKSHLRPATKVKNLVDDNQLSMEPKVDSAPGSRIRLKRGPPSVPQAYGSISDAAESTGTEAKDDTYVFGSDDEDSFLDYSSEQQGGSVNKLVDSSVSSLEEPTTSDSHRSFGNLSSLITPPAEQSSQLYNLLKDSMMPSFESNWHPEQVERTDGPRDSENSRSTVRGSFDAVVSTSDHSSQKRARSNRKRDQQAVELNRGSLEAGEWPRVPLCGLIQGAHYVIKISAWNSVGQNEDELRLLAAPEGLESDAEGRRLLISRAEGSNRGAQSGGQIGERINNMLAMQQWPILLPITLMVTLMAIILIIGLLLKRVGPGDSTPSHTTTTTTSTTVTSGSSLSGSAVTNRCHEYLNESHANLASANFRSMGAPSAITEAATVATSDFGFNDSAGSSTNNNNLDSGYGGVGLDHAGALYAHDSISGNKRCLGDSAMDEPAYGVVGLGHLFPSIGNNSGSATCQKRVGALPEANRLSSSPTTTMPSTSTNSNSNNMTINNNASGHHHYGTQQQQHPIYATSPADGHSGDLIDSPGTRSRNVYLCSSGAKQDDSDNQNVGLFYGVSPAVAAAAYGQLQRQFQQQRLTVNAQDMRRESQDRPNFPDGQHSSVMLQERDSCNIYGPHLDQMRGFSNDAEQKQMSNCFLNIVEEVARANGTLRSNPMSCDQKQSDQSSLQCNQPECINNHHQMYSQTSHGEEMNHHPSSYANNNQQVNAGVNQALKTQDDMSTSSNRLMFDPTYATIRKTFPQAFRYLTLQQHHSCNQNAIQLSSRELGVGLQQQQANHLNQSASVNNQRPQVVSGLGTNNQSNFSDKYGFVQEANLLNSNELAALNLLTPSNNLANNMQQH